MFLESSERLHLVLQANGADLALSALGDILGASDTWFDDLVQFRGQESPSHAEDLLDQLQLVDQLLLDGLVGNRSHLHQPSLEDVDEALLHQGALELALDVVSDDVWVQVVATQLVVEHHLNVMGLECFLPLDDIVSEL